jgi:hypothetical protein
MGITEKSRFAQARRNWNTRRRALLTDYRNRRNFGPEAPKFAERLWVDPAQIESTGKIASSKQSGQVIHTWPHEALSPLLDSPSIKACLQHWRDGLPWEQTGIIEQMLKAIEQNGKVDRLRTEEDVRIRYEELDRLFFETSKDMRLKTRSELVPGNFREEGGILVHIGPEGKPVFGRKGHHRLAMALCLRLQSIPVQIGVVHDSAIGELKRFRSPQAVL